MTLSEITQKIKESQNNTLLNPIFRKSIDEAKNKKIEEVKQINEEFLNQRNSDINKVVEIYPNDNKKEKFIILEDEDLNISISSNEENSKNQNQANESYESNSYSNFNKEDKKLFESVYINLESNNNNLSEIKEESNSKSNYLIPDLIGKKGNILKNNSLNRLDIIDSD